LSVVTEGSIFGVGGVLEIIASSASSVLKFSTPLQFDPKDLNDEPVG
jgi:hypothetical protein